MPENIFEDVPFDMLLDTPGDIPVVLVKVCSEKVNEYLPMNLLKSC